MGFALAVCVTCSVILAFTAGALKPSIEKNKELDVHKNILFAMNLIDRDKADNPEKVETLFSEKVEGKVLDKEGNVVPGRDPAEVGIEDEIEQLPVYISYEGDKIQSVAMPVMGKGLWSKIYGYIALENDFNTVRGITFYQHGETPGLGGEIGQQWYQAKFEGKKIFDSEGNLQSIAIAKGAVPEDYPEEKKQHMVDGVSGATLTGKGITEFLEHDLSRYLPYLKKMRQSS
jgi:Na+-transporting NADH:ubiquinone oxidoreductase subunit C